MTATISKFEGVEAIVGVRVPRDFSAILRREADKRDLMLSDLLLMWAQSGYIAEKNRPDHLRAKKQNDKTR